MVLVSLHLIKDKKYRMSTHQFYLIILYPFDCCIIFWHGCHNSVHKNDTRSRFDGSAVGMMRSSSVSLHLIKDKNIIYPLTNSI